MAIIGTQDSCGSAAALDCVDICLPPNLVNIGRPEMEIKLAKFPV
jgi:hypothetical protein